MGTFRVKMKCGKPGEYKHDSHNITVNAEDAVIAVDLAINKFKNANGANSNKECEAIDVEKIK